MEIGIMKNPTTEISFAKQKGDILCVLKMTKPRTALSINLN